MSQVRCSFLLTFPPDGQMADSVQSVDGLSSLMANNFYHKYLDCSRVLVNLNGHVKIGAFISLAPQHGSIALLSGKMAESKPVTWHQSREL
ncbi:hypothetical protein N7533_011749 [Penicillium manginii]|uniref:uncharacterized protein n=1 Tax=Penicillium manginii TaxID=203109 RepID=UPI0025495A77|nr:uncharacterized protein N7533_011749 [Penicillium manginii]KAJ5742340.1 hypothetical protein N7533_011749 [Penicillium manginii]